MQTLLKQVLKKQTLQRSAFRKTENRQKVPKESARREFPTARVRESRRGFGRCKGRGRKVRARLGKDEPQRCTLKLRSRFYDIIL